MTIQKALSYARQQLEQHTDAPNIDADRLLLHVLAKKDSSWLFAHSDLVLSNDQSQKFEGLLSERKTGKPLAYILGEAEFYGRTFFVNENVLIPRPETEKLIDTTLQYLQQDATILRNIVAKSHPYTIADIGTGSGIIATTLALEIPNIHIVATDISSEALEVAKKNVERHGVADRIEFIQGDMLEALAHEKIDLIVSNPPYVPTTELESHAAKSQRDKIETAGLDFEPRIALDGGPDGQKYIEQIKTAGIPAILEVTGGAVVTL